MCGAICKKYHTIICRGKFYIYDFFTALDINAAIKVKNPPLPGSFSAAKKQSAAPPQAGRRLKIIAPFYVTFSAQPAKVSEKIYLRFFLLYFTAAAMNSRKSGCADWGRDLNSGWNCTPT